MKGLLQLGTPVNSDPVARVECNDTQLMPPRPPIHLMRRLNSYSMKLTIFKKKKRPKRFPLISYYVEEQERLDAEYETLMKEITAFQSSFQSSKETKVLDVAEPRHCISMQVKRKILNSLVPADYFAKARPVETSSSRIQPEVLDVAEPMHCTSMQVKRKILASLVPADYFEKARSSRIQTDARLRTPNQNK